MTNLVCELSNGLNNVMVDVPEIGTAYYYIDMSGVEFATWEGDDFDQTLFERGEVFCNRDAAERALRVRKTHFKLRQLARQLNTEPIDFKNPEATKWCLRKSIWEGKLKMSPMGGVYMPGQVYFTDNVLDKIMEVIPASDLWEYCKEDLQ